MFKGFYNEEVNPKYLKKNFHKCNVIVVAAVVNVMFPP